MDKVFYIIDGNSLVYRSYYAIPRLTNAKGEPTNAVYGFTNTLFKLLYKRQVDYVACVFDSPGPTIRHEKFSSYKSHRKGMPDDLLRQLSPIKEVLKAMRIAVFEEEGYEADDILAVLAEKGKKEKCRVFVITGDKDAMQLVGDRVSMLLPGKEEKEISPKEVKEILGVAPSMVPDLIGLMGDSSDGLPGVPGIGPKTASRLINEYGSLEDIYKKLSSIDSPLAEKLKKYRDSCQEVRDLAVLNQDIPLETDWNRLKHAGPDKVQLVKVFRQLGFKSLLQRLLKEEKQPELAPEVFRGKEEIAQLIDGCRKKKEVFVYFEKKKAELVLAPDRDDIFLFARPFPELKEIFLDRDIKKIGHGFKELLKTLWLQGLELDGLYFDIEIASYVLNPERPSHDLNGLSLDYFGKVLNERYSEAVETLFSLKEKMALEIKDAGQEELFYNIEMPLIKILAGMEKEGIRVNRKKLALLSKKMAREISIKEERIFSIAQEKFNLNSSQQVGRVLFHKMGLPPQKRTKTGFSTDSEVLETLAPIYPVAYEILDWRELYKIKSTYVDGLIKLIAPKTIRLYTTFNQTVTSTGRLSSSNPNLQNIPIKGIWGKYLRGVFEAGAGRLLMSADYSQIELRVLAHLSDDSSLKEIFRHDEDIHTATACHVFKLKEEEINPEMRRRAKTINFGIIYGISAFGLAKQLGTGPQEAQDYIDRYMERFPEARQYLESLISEAKKNGFARTLLGRRRPLSGGPDMERLAVNTPIQGGAADIIKLAMVKIDEEFRKKKLKAIMLLQVHDELLFEVPEKELKKTSQTVKSIMENAFPLSIPLKVNISWGRTWADM